MQHVIVSGYQFQLGNQVLPGLVTVARFDGKHPSLVCATTGGRVLIHSPHNENGPTESESAVRFLNINKNITAIGAGPLVPGKDHDVLFVGTGTSLMAYDVERNADVFYKDVPDGVSSITFGWVRGIAEPLVIVGGHCSIQGFNFEGKELFWTVAGETVGALAFVNFVKQDERLELLAGSDDFAIRAFKEEEVINEVTEADKVVGLAHMAGNKVGRFAYSLDNGTVGVYHKSNRVWRVKSKHKCVALAALDLNADGITEVVAGWNNGSITVRHGESGEMVFKDSLGAGIAGLVASDYRLTGSPDILAVSTSGEVKGYLSVPADVTESRQTASEQDQKIINELQQRKGDLLMELKGLEESLKQVKSGGSATTVPVNTSVYAELLHDAANSACEIVLSTKSEAAVIVNVAVFDWEGGMFNGECLHFSPAEPSPTCRVPLSPPKNTGGQVHIQVHVGGRARASGAHLQLHVFELSLPVPRFCMFLPAANDVVGLSDDDPPLTPTNNGPTGGMVTFTIKEQLARIITWIESCFLVGRIADSTRQSNSVTFTWLCLRAPKPGSDNSDQRRDSGAPRPRYLVIQAKRKEGCHVQIRVDDMELAGELVQDLCKYLGLEELESSAIFPAEMDSLRTVLAQVADFNAQRVRMTADMADVSQRVKMLVVKAEDARILGDMESMSRHYAELFKLNNQLIGEYVKRSNNHQALLEALKEVNHTIQKAANLRMGQAKTKLVTDCRAAIKGNNTQSLFSIISSGSNVRIGAGLK